MKNLSGCALSFLFVFSLLSCSMFTESLGNPRDLSKVLEDASVQEIVDLLNSKQVLSSEDSKGIAKALSKKDINELNNLSIEDQGTIVNTVVSGMLPTPNDLLGILTLDSLSSMDTEQTDDFMNVVLNEGLSFIDTSVSYGIIESFFINDEIVKALITEEPDAFLMGVLALTAAITKEGGILTNDATLSGLFSNTFTTLGDEYYKDTNDTVELSEKEALEKILASDLSTTPDNVRALVNAVIVLYVFSEEDGLSSMGGLEGIFSGFLGAEV